MSQFRGTGKRVVKKKMHAKWELEQVSDDALLAKLDQLVCVEQRLLADVLAHMAEVDARKLFCDFGFASMFQYSVERLKLSEGAARHRITAARLTRRWPVILERIAAGEIHLSGLGVLTAHLSDGNHVELLAAAAHKTKRQIEELIRARFPLSDVLPILVPVDSDTAALAMQPAPEVNSSSQPTPQTQPLSADSFCATVTIDRQCRDKLAQARALLSHKIPCGDLGKVLDCALDALLAQLRKQKFAETNAPRRASAETKPGSRHIPARVKREVAVRDGQRCTFVGKSGQRCSEVARLEFHHDEPFARKGPSTVENVRLLCAAHNRHQAELDYGQAHIEARQRERAKPSGPPEEMTKSAMGALRKLGFKASIARDAVGQAASTLPADCSMEALLRASLSCTRSL